MDEIIILILAIVISLFSLSNYMKAEKLSRQIKKGIEELKNLKN